MTCAPTHGPRQGDVALWYAQEVMSEATVFDAGTVAMACEVARDHPQDTDADRQQAQCLLDGLGKVAA